MKPANQKIPGPLGPWSRAVIRGSAIALLLFWGCGANRLDSAATVITSSGPVMELEVPTLRQGGFRANCGPTAAAMVLGAYQGTGESLDLRGLRDDLGDWSFDHFAPRRVKLPGVPAGMTPPSVLAATLNQFSDQVTFRQVSGADATLSMGERFETGLDVLRGSIAMRRPVLVLVQSGLLWPDAAESLHWVVVKGLGDDTVIINDPAQGNRETFELQHFMMAWKLNPFFRSLPFVDPYVAIAGDEPLPAAPPVTEEDPSLSQSESAVAKD